MINIKGLQKTSLLDYPGKISCIVFVAGCNFRCPFCQNPDLVLRPENLPTISEEDFFKFLTSRIGLLDGVVISGGEPTLQQDLPKLMRKIKQLGFLVKLDTNGTNPEVVKKLIDKRLVDYVALDYKGLLKKYYQYIGKCQMSNVKCQNYNGKIEKTIEILLKSGLDFELRTTVVPTLHTKEDLLEMAKELNNLTMKQSRNVEWYLQQFRPTKCLDPKFDKIKPYPKEFFEEILPELRKYLANTFLRGIE